MATLSSQIQTNYLNISHANNQKVIDNHREAARQHNEAAKYHFEAASYLESGDYENAFKSTVEAVGHRFLAVDAEREDEKIY